MIYMHCISGIAFIAFVSINTAHSMITTYKTRDTSYQSYLKNVNRTFNFSDIYFSSKHCSIAFSQEIFYKKIFTYSDLFCFFCLENKEIAETKNYIIFNLSEKKIKKYRHHEDNLFLKRIDTEEFKKISSTKKLVYAYIGNALQESIFLQGKPEQKETLSGKKCFIYAQNEDKSYMIGSVPCEKGLSKQFYLWKNNEPENNLHLRLIPKRHLLELDDKADIIDAIVFIEKKCAFVFCNDGTLFKISCE